MATWGVKEWVAFAVPFALALAGAIGWFAFRKTLRTRLRVQRQLREDPDINEWLVVFNWSRKALYIPTIAAALVAYGLMLCHELPQEPWVPTEAAGVIGGIWLGLFILNFLVDEYEVSVKVLLIGVLVVLALMLWLSLLGWLMDFLRLFRHLKVHISSTGYLILAVVFFSAIVISWIKGLFYYVAITPNYLNIQSGPTETGEQISREEYSTRVDTGDFLERLLGFGRVIITFADHRRQPMMLLIWRIGRRAQRLESIRGKLAIDRHQPSREGTGP